MAIKRRKFTKGIRLKPTTDALEAEGEISVDSSDNKLKVQLDAQERSVVTEDQDQVLTNKEINGTSSGTNTVTIDATSANYDDTVETVKTLLKADGINPVENVQEALDAVKRELDGQNEASEIEFTPTVDIPSDNVQGAIEDVQSNLQGHLDSTTAHDASEIVYDNTTSGLLASDAQSAIDEVESRLDTAETDLNTAESKVDDLITLSGYPANTTDLGTFTGGVISDNTDLQNALQELETAIDTNTGGLTSHTTTTSAHGAIGNVVGTLNAQTLKYKIYEDAYFSKMTSEGIDDNDQAGADIVLTEPTQPVIRLTGDLVTPASLDSITGIALTAYNITKVVTIINATSNDIEIKNDSGATTDARILTGTADNITLAPDAALLLKYDPTSLRWRVIGGTGSGTSKIKLPAAEDITVTSNPLAIYIDASGNVGLTDPSQDTKMEFIGFTNTSVLAGENADVFTSGKLAGFTGLTAGEFLYADVNTPGEYTQTEPTEPNVYIIKIGKAISSTEILVNPDLAVSAEFNSGLDADDTINNGATNENVSGLLFDGTIHRAAKITYSIYRYTDTEELSQVGDFKVLYKPIEGTWSLGADNYHGDNAGVTFTITSSGQVQYTSTSLLGANYGSKLQIKISELFDI